jgi:hypothetical protein
MDGHFELAIDIGPSRRLKDDNELGNVAIETLTSIRETPASISKNLPGPPIDFFFETASWMPRTRNSVLADAHFERKCRGIDNENIDAASCVASSKIKIERETAHVPAAHSRKRR